MSEALKSAAMKVAEEMADGDTANAFDPSWIVVIAEALVPLIQAIMDCLAASKVPDAASNPSYRQRLVVRLNLQRTLGTKDFRANGGPKLVDSVLKAAAKMSAEEVEGLYASV